MRRVQAFDAWLLAVPRWLQAIAIVVTLLLMTWQALPHVPREVVDYARFPVLRGISQPDQLGPDTVGDGYEARVVLNNPRDMYTKTQVAQTEREAALWSKPASAPYPPAVLLVEAALYRIGEWTGLRFYGMVLILAGIFLALSLRYFLATRWYLFPALYLNFSYLGYRFVFVQDCSYLVMLVVAVAALLAARRRGETTHALMGLAIAMKLTPLYYAKNVLTMPRRAAWTFAAILFAGLAVPYFVWDNYLYIFAFHETLKGDWLGLVGALGWGVPFVVGVWYVEMKLAFDLEDRVGWGMVPVAMMMAMKMNVPRHLLLALLVPDKRGLRNLSVAFALGLQALLPGLIRFGSVLSILVVLMFFTLFFYLHQIGWATVIDDARHPWRTLRTLLTTRHEGRGAA